MTRQLIPFIQRIYQFVTDTNNTSVYITKQMIFVKKFLVEYNPTMLQDSKMKRPSFVISSESDSLSHTAYANVLESFFYSNFNINGLQQKPSLRSIL